MTSFRITDDGKQRVPLGSYQETHEGAPSNSTPTFSRAEALSRGVVFSAVPANAVISVIDNLPVISVIDNLPVIEGP